jgi:2'-5' RNA ligase
MRLFIAINFTDEVKDALCETISDLKGAARRGRYTLWENLHLTLVFIGESERVDDILDVMGDVCEETFSEPLDVRLSEAGAFRGRGGDLHWIGVENTPALSKLAKRLSEELRAEGFEIEKRRFTPHITIGREIILGSKADIRVHPASMKADHISLMRSDRAGGRLVYTEIAAVYVDSERERERERK